MKLTIDYQDGTVRALFPYNEELLNIVRNIDNRRWNPEGKYWTVGLSEVSKLTSEAEAIGVDVVYSYKYRETFMQEPTATLEKEFDYLFAYQKVGVNFLYTKETALLADEMGLGKSVSSLVTIKKLLKEKEDTKILIACPLGLIQTWLNENEKFTGLKIQVVRGNKNQRAKQWAMNSNVFITNYETLRSDGTPQIWGLIILDECSRIKNFQTKLYQAVRRLYAPRKIALSGTPIENSITDLYSIVTWLNTGIFPNYYSFRTKFIVEEEVRLPDGRVFNKIIGYKNIPELKRMIAPIFLRREKVEVLKDLPEVLQQNIWCELTKDENKKYNALLWEAKELINEGQSPIGVGQKMRHLLSGVDGKIDELVNIAKETEGQIIVFGEFINSLLSTENLLKENNISCKTIYGDVKQEIRNEFIKDFTEKKFRVLIMQTRVGGHGLNLQNASTVVFLNRPYNPAIEDQAISRAHRMGQKNNVLVYYLLTNTAFERRINEILNLKKEISEAVMITNTMIEVAKDVKKKKT